MSWEEGARSSAYDKQSKTGIYGPGFLTSKKRVMEEEGYEKDSIRNFEINSENNSENQSELPSADGTNYILDRFFNDIQNLQNEEVQLINMSNPSQWEPQASTERDKKPKKICNEFEPENESIEEDEKPREKIYSFQKNKKRHKRIKYNRLTLELLFKNFKKYIKENRLPRKRKIQKYIFMSGNKVLRKAGTEKVYYVLKNRIRKENS